ncbi:DsbA family protein [Massilia horti]|uniref:Disulfide bond formation protein DsbA n=1 Tax=Massilia horti TaxID=2562153 RepID=A0A4Y9SLM6_9BURK|nr:thioredoxin domain-containing protein [Massilia horti]TFW27341.1 disulfide bond formation protein DsbA [Massilia horti]
MSLAIPVNESDHIQGHVDAPATLVEYGDYQCPYCKAAYFVIKEVQTVLGDKMRLVFRNMPLIQVHPLAELAAEAAEAAGAQGQFWPVHDAIYENQDTLGADMLAALADPFVLDMTRFVEDMRSHRFLAKIREDLRGAVLSGAAGTPTFFINGEHYEGRYDAPSLAQALSAAAATGRP